MSTGNDVEALLAEEAELKAELEKMVEVQSVDAMKLTRAFATMAGDVSPVVLWTAATTMALMAMHSMEDASPKDDGGFARRIVADFKAHFIGQLMTRSASRL